MTEEKFVNILNALFPRGEVIKEEDKLTFKYSGKEFNIDIEKITMNKEKEVANTILHNKNYYEILLSNENRMPLRLLIRKDNLIMEDANLGLEYKIDMASEEYILFLIENLYDKGLITEFRRRVMLGSKSSSDMSEEITDFFDFLRIAFRRMYTLQIKSQTNKSISEFKKLSNSVIFHVAYNLEVSFVEIKTFEEYFNIERMHGVRRFNGELIEPPRRSYNQDLVYHYQMAISTDSPFLQYISYYHIIEHFLEKIYNEELIKLIQKEITHPSFSIRKDNDVKKIISIISKKLQVRKEELIINEREAVKLTLDRYINLDNLINNLNTLDSNLINYYKETEVSFSKGQKVELQNPKRDQVIQNLSHRIYETRNAIVHSKDTEKSKFIPFKHDKCLMKEIPLIRFISEEIILSNSEIL